MIFLKDNVLIERDLSHDDIKPRLLGTVPSLTDSAMTITDST